jgi:transposase
MAGLRRFRRELSEEAEGLVRDRGVTVAQSSQDLGGHVNFLHTWVREFQVDPAQAFPGEERQTPEAAEVTHLRRFPVQRNGSTVSPKRGTDSGRITVIPRPLGR